MRRFKELTSSFDTESDDHDLAKSSTSQGSSNEEEIYCEPYAELLKTTSQGI